MDYTRDTMAAISVYDLSQEAINSFWRQKKMISTRSHQKGLHYAMEAYVQNVNVVMVSDKRNVTLEARVYRSQCKREKPHSTVITFAENNIEDQHCTCIAG